MSDKQHVMDAAAIQAELREGPPLNEFDKDEWREAARQLDRNYSDEKFDADWAEFVAMKQRRKAN